MYRYPIKRFILKKIITVLVFIYGAVGCSMMQNAGFSSNQKNEYLENRNGPDLVIEKPLNNNNISEFYRLPNQPQNARVSIKPPVIK